MTQETNPARRQSGPRLFSMPQSPYQLTSLTPDHLICPTYPADVSTALHQTSPNVKNSLHRDTDVKNRLLDSVGEGEGGMIWENSAETCILPYMKETASASPMQEAGHPKLVLGQPSGVGYGGRWGGDSVYLWLIHADPWQRPSQYCRVTVLQLK